MIVPFVRYCGKVL